MQRLRRIESTKLATGCAEKHSQDKWFKTQFIREVKLKSSLVLSWHNSCVFFDRYVKNWTRIRGTKSKRKSYVIKQLPLASSIQLAREVLRGWNTKTSSLAEIQDPQIAFHLSHTAPWACWSADFYNNTT